MPNQNIFCNVPWTNVHIYWDGSYGICCSEKTKPYTVNETKYNIENLTVLEWFNQTPIKNFRKQIHQDNKIAACIGCYSEEENNYESRRIKENFKSVIFTELNFAKSYLQSPAYKKFEESKNIGDTYAVPIDWHVDFGNECNLACKMCGPNASSKIASQYKNWGIIENIKNSNWTRNEKSWNNFLNSIQEVKNLNRLHFMGGEVLLNKRFHELIDYLIEAKRTDISISFVTNGTILDLELLEKLKKFKSFNVELSIESIFSNNSYIRQGSDTKIILQNIQYLKSIESRNFQLVLRSVPQLLNVNNYDRYIQWAWENKLSIQGIPLMNPKYLQISVLPKDIKKKFVGNYKKVIEFIENNTVNSIKTIATGRDISRLNIQLIRECNSIIKFLELPEPDNAEYLRYELINWLIKWDNIYKLDAIKEYPEYADFLTKYGYKI